MRGGNCAACADAAESMRTTDSRANRLFIFLAGFFLTNALIGEFVGVAMMAGAVVAGALTLTLFGFLIARRVGVETRALEAAAVTSSKNHNRT